MTTTTTPMHFTGEFIDNISQVDASCDSLDDIITALKNDFNLTDTEINNALPCLNGWIATEPEMSIVEFADDVAQIDSYLTDIKPSAVALLAALLKS